MSSWKFVKFTESRWLTVGTSARTIVVALLTGLPNLVDELLENAGGKWRPIRGFARLGTDRRAFLVQAALASRVAEGVQVELTEDTKSVFEQIKEGLEDSIAYSEGKLSLATTELPTPPLTPKCHQKERTDGCDS